MANGLEDKSSQDQETRRMGAHGIAALGSNSPPEMIPKLMMIITNHPDEDSRYVAAFALRTLGPAAWSSGLSSYRGPRRCMAAVIMEKINTP